MIPWISFYPLFHMPEIRHEVSEVRHSGMLLQHLPSRWNTEEQENRPVRYN
jgi:hypothetical protein